MAIRVIEVPSSVRFVRPRVLPPKTGEEPTIPMKTSKPVGVARHDRRRARRVQANEEMADAPSSSSRRSRLGSAYRRFPSPPGTTFAVRDAAGPISPPALRPGAEEAKSPRTSR